MYIRPTRSSPRNNPKTRLRRISEIIGVPVKTVLSYVRQLKRRTGEKIPTTIQADRRVAGRQVGLYRLPLTLEIPPILTVNGAYEKWSRASANEKPLVEPEV